MSMTIHMLTYFCILTIVLFSCLVTLKEILFFVIFPIGNSHCQIRVSFSFLLLKIINPQNIADIYNRELLTTYIYIYIGDKI